MTQKLFNRYARITVKIKAEKPSEDYIIFTEEFKLTFKAESFVSVSDTANYQIAEVALYNISDAIKTQLARNATDITIDVGYYDFHDVIFAGSIKNVAIVKEGTDVLTILYCSSSLLEATQTKPVAYTVNNENAKTVLAKLCDMAGVLYQLPDTIPYKISDIAFKGNILDVVAQICQLPGINLVWGMHNRVLIIIDITAPIKEALVYEIGPESGLIDVPQISDTGVQLKTYINPKIHVNSLIKLNTKYASFDIGALNWQEDRLRGSNFNAYTDINKNWFQGFFNVLTINYSGDTRGNTWYSQLDCKVYDRTGRGIKDE